MFGDLARFLYGLDPTFARLGSVQLWYYGLAYALGFLTIHLWLMARRQRIGWSRSAVVDCSLIVTVCVLIGGRAFNIAVYEWGYYREHPAELFSFWQGGMATHGVLLGAVVGIALFSCWQRRRWLSVADQLAVPGAVLMALGRIANHINGGVYGSQTEVSWAVHFAYAEGARHPVALYECAKNLVVAAILIGVQSRRPATGVVFGHFVLWYGLLRLVSDYFRDYDSYWLGVGRGQFFNLTMALAGLVLILVLRRRAASGEAREPAPPEDARGTGLWLKAGLFYALLLFCLTIASGWSQPVLDLLQAGGSIS
jgi:phosphatidylglycerol:prolipoprotein diacylglycerol transferase